MQGDHHKQNKTTQSFYAEEGHGSACSTHTVSLTVSDEMAGVELIVPHVQVVEEGVKGLKMSVDGQLACDYSNSQSVALPVEV